MSGTAEQIKGKRGRRSSRKGLDQYHLVTLTAYSTLDIIASSFIEYFSTLCSI